MKVDINNVPDVHFHEPRPWCFSPLPNKHSQLPGPPNNNGINSRIALKLGIKLTARNRFCVPLDLVEITRMHSLGKCNAIYFFKREANLPICKVIHEWVMKPKLF